MVSSSLLRVVCRPASWSGVRRPWMTWCRRVAVRRGLSAIRAWSWSAGTAANAGAAGTSTVSSGVVLSGSTRLAAVSAWTNAFSAGFSLAAVATGAWAMSAKLPGPDAGTAAQPGPNGASGAADGVAAALALADVLDDVAVAD